MSVGVATLTFSPALDVSTSVDTVAHSHKLRCEPPRSEPGGGGINVARVAQRLGVDAVAVAPLGRDRADSFIEQLEAEGVTVEPIITGDPTRLSFSVTERASGHQYRFVLPPQQLDPDDVDRCVATVGDLGPTVGCVVVSGSIDVPDVSGAIDGIVAAARPTPVIIDTSGNALAAALDSNAFLVKPSARELSAIVGHRLDTEADVVRAAVETAATASVGAILVSIGAGGAILVRQAAAPVRFRAPTVDVRSTIGAGDSLVAGVASGLARGLGDIDAIRLGIAAGTATVLTDGTALCEASVVDELMPLVTVQDDRSS